MLKALLVAACAQRICARDMAISQLVDGRAELVNATQEDLKTLQRRGPVDDKVEPLTWLELFVFFACIAGFITSLWQWSNFLHSKPEPEVPVIRRRMLVFVVLATVLELRLWMHEHVHAEFIYITIFLVFWGYLDAIIRFPRSYDWPEPFFIKHITLYTLRVPVLVFAFKELNDCHGWLWALVVVHTVLLPAIYMNALPSGDGYMRRKLPTADVIEEDVAIQFVKLLSDKQRRQRLATGAKRLVVMSLVEVAKRSPICACVITKLSATVKAKLREKQLP